jgi:hypothetical protein
VARPLPPASHKKTGSVNGRLGGGFFRLPSSSLRSYASPMTRRFRDCCCVIRWSQCRLRHARKLVSLILPSRLDFSRACFRHRQFVNSITFTPVGRSRCRHSPSFNAVTDALSPNERFQLEPVFLRHIFRRLPVFSGPSHVYSHGRVGETARSGATKR